MIIYDSSFTNTNGLAFPDTLALNVTAPGAGDGTEYVKLLVDDIWGRAYSLLDYAGLTPDGVTEAPGTAQVIEAIGKGFAVGPGIGVTYWKNGTPAANGDRVLLLQGQVILIATYPLLVAACYIGDGNNADTDYTGFYKTSDAGGVTRSTSGTYMVLPDARGLSLKNIGDAIVNGRTKTGPVKLTELQEDQGQSWQLGAEEDASGAVDYWGRTGGRDIRSDTSAQVTNTAPRFDGSQGASTMLHAKNDGTHDDPREGFNVRDSVLGTNLGITY